MKTSTDEILSTKEYTVDYRYLEYLLSPTLVFLSSAHIYVEHLCMSNIFLALLGVRDTDSDVRKHFLSFRKKRRLAETFLVKVLFEV